MPPVRNIGRRRPRVVDGAIMRYRSTLKAVEVGDGPAVRASVEAMEKEVDGVLLIDDGITVLTLAVFDETAVSGVAEGWVGGTAALTAAVDLALLLLEGVAKGK